MDDPALGPGAAWYEARNLLRQALGRELSTLSSLSHFAGSNASDSVHEKALADQVVSFAAWIDNESKARGAQGTEPKAVWPEEAAAQKIPSASATSGRLPIRTTMFSKASPPERVAKIKLLNSEATPLLNTQDLSELYAYEIANFGDGRRTVGGIQDAVSANMAPWRS